MKQKLNWQEESKTWFVAYVSVADLIFIRLAVCKNKNNTWSASMSCDEAFEDSSYLWNRRLENFESIDAAKQGIIELFNNNYSEFRQTIINMEGVE